MGETSRTLRLQDATASDEGNYRVIVTWNNGTVTSSAGTLTVRPIDQTIDFEPLANCGRGEAPAILDATASSGLQVTFAVVSGPATVNGASVGFTGFGNVTIRALQSGSGNYDAATPVDRSFLVTGEDLAAWRSRFSTQEALEADFDGDGVNTLLEFALNLRPNEPAQVNPDVPGGLPVVRLEEIGGERRLTAEFVRRRAASFPGITYSFEFTSSLANRGIWSPATMETVTQIDEIWERVKVADSETRPPRFGRLRVTQP